MTRGVLRPAALLLVCSMAAAGTEPCPRGFQLQWRDLAPLVVRNKVSFTTVDGVRLQGRVRSVQAEHMVLEISKTSDRRLWPKGRAEIPRTAVKELKVIEGTGRVWTVVGATIGAIAGLAVGVPVGLYASQGAGWAIGFGLSALGTGLGIISDKRVTWIEVQPEGGAR